MGKNVRRGHASNVRCASCGQLTRRDRSVYLFRDGIKAYYCPDCAKKIHGSRLYKGMPKFVRRPVGPRVKRKFTMYSKTETEGASPEVATDQFLQDEPADNKDDQQEAQNNQ